MKRGVQRNKRKGQKNTKHRHDMSIRGFFFRGSTRAKPHHPTHETTVGTGPFRHLHGGGSVVVFWPDDSKTSFSTGKGGGKGRPDPMGLSPRGPSKRGTPSPSLSSWNHLIHSGNPRTPRGGVEGKREKGKKRRGGVGRRGGRVASLGNGGGENLGDRLLQARNKKELTG